MNVQFRRTFAQPGAEQAQSWLDTVSMTIGTWYEISGTSPDLGLSSTNSAASVDPDPNSVAPYNGISGFDSIWNAWGSSCYIPWLGIIGSMLYWGGGHRDYYGNGIVRFDLYTRTWSMLTQPSLAGPFESLAPLNDGAFNDNTPAPPHVYNMLQADPSTQSMIITKCITNINAPDVGGAIPRPWMFSTGTLAWRKGSLATGINASTGAPAVYDSNRQCHWILDLASGDFGKFTSNVDNGDGTFGTWQVFASNGNNNTYTNMGYDPVLDRIVVADFAVQTLYRKDCTNMTANRTTITTSGGPTLINQSAFEYSTAFGGFIYHASGTGDVYLLTTANDWTNGTYSLLTANNNGKSFTVNNGYFGKSRPVTIGSKTYQILSRSEVAKVQIMRLN